MSDAARGEASPDAALARTLLTPRAVRERAHRMLALGIAGELPHFTVDSGKLCRCADYVLDTIRRNYPTFQVPFHARWRHFAAGGFDRWATLDRDAVWPSDAARARAAFDLAIVSVLLDAGAGPDWFYLEAASGERFARSEGLAVASFDMFAAGLFSARPGEPLRADASRARVPAGGRGCGRLSGRRAESDGRPRRPGRPAPAAGPGRRGDPGRVRPRTTRRGRAVCSTTSPRRSRAASCRAEAILSALLEHLGPIWPGRIALGGVDLGDTWRHPGLVTEDATTGLLPFHKLSQWLAYSLIEPLQAAGVGVSGRGRAHRPGRIPQWRALRRPGVLALKDPTEAGAAACGRLHAGGGMARPHGGAAGRRRGADPQPRWGSRPSSSRSPRRWKAAPGRPAGASRGRSGRAARRRSR